MNARHLLIALVCGGLFAAVGYGQRNLRDIPEPDSDAELKSFIVADGFEVNLFASDPMIAKPIHMNFDATGRLWVATSEVYPQIKPGQAATDKIVILEDQDGDGRADKRQVFADDLLIPTGVAPGDGGAYVANSTELLHLSDSDGDGKADRRRVVLSGFGTEDTHHLLHTLQWGPDGRLYMNQSIYIHSHVETPYGVKRLGGGGIWQFRPDTLHLNVFCRGFVNPWGHAWDRWGQSFATDGAYGEGINYVFPGAVFATAPGAKRRIKGLNPGSPKHCGLAIVSSRHLPESWQGNMLTNDFRAHRVCRFVVTEDGSGYASRQETELIKSNHVAFRPVDVKIGPDGAIYIADWYNPIIQHGEVDFRDPRRDKQHGRIWRVTHKGRDLVDLPEIPQASIDQLVSLLAAPEAFTRTQARLELKQRDADAVAKALDAWVSRLDPQGAEYPHQRLAALWTYQAVRRPNLPLLRQLAAAGDHRVRAAAVRVAVAWIDASEDSLELFASAARDEHPRVRLEGVRALAEIPSAAAAEAAMEALDAPLDRFLDFALWQTMRDLRPYWLPAVERGELDFGGDLEKLTFALEAAETPGIAKPLLKLVTSGRAGPEQTRSALRLIGSVGQPGQVGEAFDWIADQAPSARGDLLTALLDGNASPPAESPEALRGWLAAGQPPRLREVAIRAAGQWKLRSAESQLAEIAEDGSSPRSLRTAALDALAGLDTESAEATVVKLAVGDGQLSVRQAAVTALARRDAPRAARMVAEILPELTATDDPRPWLAAVLDRKGGPAALAAALADARLQPDVAKLSVRAIQDAARPMPKLLDVVRSAGGLTDQAIRLTPDEFDAMLQLISKGGDPVRGEAVFRRPALQCLNCHAIGGAGGSVGPDLSSIGASAQPDYLLESLVNPNAKVKENYHSRIVETVDGRLVIGVPVRENDDELVLRDPNDREIRIPRDEIEEISQGRSLMPEGLVNSLTRPELADMTRFLSELGKVGPYAVGKEQVVRRYETLIHTPQAHRRLNRTSHDTAATDDPALTWRPAYSRVAGDLPLDELDAFTIHRGQPAVQFVRFTLECSEAGPVAMEINDLAGLKLWLDGRPTPVASPWRPTLAAGRHEITLAILPSERKTPLRIELTEGSAQVVNSN